MKKKKRSNYGRKRLPYTHRNTPLKYYTKEDTFVSRMASILMIPKSRVKQAFSKRPITTIRMNSLKGSPEETKDILLKKGYALELVPWSPNTYFVLNKDKSEVSQTEEYYDGRYYIQNLSSILAVLILNPQKGQKILDMCASPGSKTTHIADLTENQSEIFANDIEIARVSDMNAVIKQFGAESVKTLLSDGRDFGKKYPAYFDNVLLDAPCSGEGLIYFRGPRPLRYWSMNKVKRSSYLQKELIVSAFKTLKHGKTMVYSTCTLEPEENEGTITYLLDNFPNARVQKIDILEKKEFEGYMEVIKPGIKKWSGNIYNKQVENSIRIIPNERMMGFYIAKIFKE